MLSASYKRQGLLLVVDRPPRAMGTLTDRGANPRFVTLRTSLAAGVMIKIMGMRPLERD